MSSLLVGTKLGFRWMPTTIDAGFRSSHIFLRRATSAILSISLNCPFSGKAVQSSSLFDSDASYTISCKVAGIKCLEQTWLLCKLCSFTSFSVLSDLLRQISSA